jgi:hypothetical protein
MPTDDIVLVSAALWNFPSWNCGEATDRRGWAPTASGMSRNNHAAVPTNAAPAAILNRTLLPRLPRTCPNSQNARSDEIQHEGARFRNLTDPLP